jgi:acetyltransferase
MNRPMRLTPFLRPRSVAIVGAGDRPTSSGGAVLANLRRAGFSGEIVPINPKLPADGSIGGLPARASLRQLQPAADLAVVVVRPELIPEVVRDAAASGHRHLLILPGGFSEAGEAGRAREDEVRRIAEEAGITIAGPNCAGTIDLLDDARPFAATFLRDLPNRTSFSGRRVAFVSQSGAIAEELIAKSHAMAIPLGAVVSVGNAMHLSLADYLEHYGADDACSAVLLYAESFGDAQRFSAIARAVSRRKPVVALLGGRLREGAAAAQRHTGAASLREADARAFCERARIVQVTSLRSLLVAAKVFGRYPQGIGPRVLLLSNSGGPGVLAADRCAAEGLALPELPPALDGALRAALPTEAAVANPLDLLADAREDRFDSALSLALRHGGDAFDAVLMLHVVPFMVDAAPVVRALAQRARQSGLPLLHTMMGTLADRDAWFAAMEAAGVPMFNDGEEMAHAAGLLARRRRLLEAEAIPPASPP